MSNVTLGRGSIMIEYPAMIYRNNRNKNYIANCMVKNIVGFGKTEEDAIENLMQTLQKIAPKADISVRPIYGLSFG